MILKKDSTLKLLGGIRMPYIAFMDLLGIKSIASYSPSEYHEKIKLFQSLVNYSCKNILKCNHQLIAFSDCAYVQSDSLNGLILFFQQLRQDLMQRKVFFNAAITSGDLNIDTLGDDVDKLIMFKSENTVKVYSQQTIFTGIGIIVDSIKKEIDIENLIVKSCYNEYSSDPNEQFKKFKEFYDIKYRNNESTLNLIMKILIETYLLDQRASRYYLSGIATIIKSTDTIDSLKEYESIIFSSISKNKLLYSLYLPIQLMYIDRLCVLYRNFDIDNDFSIIDDFKKILKKSVIAKTNQEIKTFPNCIIDKENKLKLSKLLYMIY